MIKLRDHKVILDPLWREDKRELNLVKVQLRHDDGLTRGYCQGGREARLTFRGF